MAQPADPTYAPSLVHVSSDLTTILGEILLKPLYPSIESVQGIVIDTADGSLRFADVTGQKIRHVTTAGVAITSDEISLSYRPNGLAWDAYARAIYVNSSDTNTVELISVANGSVINSITIAIADHDHLFFDGSFLWVTAGANGVDGTLTQYRIEGSTPRTVRTYTLAGATAIEGVYMEGNDVWIGNDAYFHLGGANFNRILTYELQ